jgi:hypothetical protein
MAAPLRIHEPSLVVEYTDLIEELYNSEEEGNVN